MSADFYIQPAAVSVHADRIRLEAGRLEQAAAALAAVTVPPGWFGKLPQGADLAARYATSRDTARGGLGRAATVLFVTADALNANLARYSAADSSVLDAVRAICGPP